MFAAPPEIATEVHFRIPSGFWRSGTETAWIRHRAGGPLHSFLEGPAFDRHGRLYVTDLAHGRIFRFETDGTPTIFADYGGEPNGLKLHRDGRVFVADRRHGLVCFDPETGARETILTGPSEAEAFHGLNDLHFSSTGDLYFTDQGDSALEAPFGRVFRLTADGRLDLLMEGLAGPNGLVLSRDENLLYVAETRQNRILSLPLTGQSRSVRKAGVFVQLSGSPVGPDGLALDGDGNLAVVHAGFGTVWQFSPLGEPLARIRSCAGLRTTNVAYGMPDPASLYITEASEGVVLRAKMPVAGHPLFSAAP
jgi:gluconolactonase